MGSHLDDRIRTMMLDVVDQSPPPPDLPTGPPPAALAPSRFPNWVVAAGAAAAVFIAIGGVLWLIGGRGIGVSGVPIATTTVGTTQTTTTSTTLPTTTTTVTAPSTIESATAAARIAGVRFDFREHDLCVWFSGEEILEFVAEAYDAERADYPTPPEIEPASDGVWSEPQCEWTVPGTPAGWGRPDFTVALRDHSDTRFYEEGDGEVGTGPTHLEDYHESPWPDAARDMGLEDVVPDGVSFLGGFTPGFDVYVDKTDRILDFRHDLAAGSQWLAATDGEGETDGEDVQEDYRIEMRILAAMLEHMNWLEATG